MAAELRYTVSAADQGASKVFDSVGKNAKKMGEQVHGSSEHLKEHSEKLAKAREKLSEFGKAVLATAGLGIGFEVVEGFKGVVEAGERAEKTMRQTEAVLHSTHDASGLSAHGFEELANKIEGVSSVSRDVIQQGENIMATFTNVKNRVGEGNDVFERATMAATDMAAAMNHGHVDTVGLQQANIQLGKALNDPVKGMTALRKIGVSFNEDQTKNIKTMVAHNNVLGAQKVILKEVATEFGGSAAASATPMQKLGVTIEHVKEELGKNLLPVLGKLADWITGKVIPALHAIWEKYGPGVIAIFKGIWSALQPALERLKSIASLVGAQIVPTFTKLITAGRAVYDFLVKYKGVLLPVAVGIGAIVTAVYLWNTAVGVFISIMRAAAIVQAVFNAVMAVNPIALVVLALVGLAAGLVFAYKHSETFRKFVQAMWKDIATAAQWAWNTVLKPTFNFIATIALWLWNHALKPLFNLWKLEFIVVATVFKAIWNSVLHPVFNVIAAVASWLWSNVLSLLFIRAKQGWALLSAVFKATWENVLKPVFNGIATVANWLWDHILKPAFNNMETGWHALMTGLKAVWDNVLHPVFNAIGTAFTALKDGFNNNMTLIGNIWDKIKGYVGAPIKVVIETVLNGGLIKGWNWIADKALAGKFKIPNIPVPKFATGGIMPGYTPGRDVHLAALSGGEAIMRPEWVRAVGPERVHQWNAAARMGGVGGVARSLGIPGFKDGGIFDKINSAQHAILGAITSTASEVASFISNPSAYLQTMMRAPLASLNQFSDTVVGRGVSDSAQRIIAKVVDAAKSLVFSDPSGGGGGTWNGQIAPGAIGHMQQFALAQRGKIYQWSAVGPDTYDCSGLAGNFYAIATGKPLYRRYFVANNPSMGGTPGMERGGGRELTFYIGGQPGTGHITTHIGGMNAEAFGGNGTPLAIGHTGTPLSYFHTQWHIPGYATGGIVNPNVINGSSLGGILNWLRAGWPEPFLYDRGGWLMPGTSLVQNNTGRPERVLAPGADTDSVTTPIVIQLDSRSVYKGLLRLRRTLGGSWELA